MSVEGSIRAVVAVIARCEEGVDYKTGVGAVCPECGEVLSVTSTRPVVDGLRERYHRCNSATCIVRMLSLSLKSIEEKRLKVKRQI